MAFEKGTWDQLNAGSDGGLDPLYNLSKPYNPTANALGSNGSGTPGNVTAPAWNNPWGYTSWADSAGLGDYLGSNAPLFMGGLQALSGGLQAYTGLKGLSLAQKAFKQDKKAFNINLSNQTKSYNTQVADRIAGRSYATEAERAAALAAATLVDRSKYGSGG